MSSVVALLPVTTQFVPVRARAWMIVPFIFGCGGVITAFINQHRATSPIFTVMTAIVPWAGWGALFGATVVGSVVCAITAGWWAYRVANLAGFVGAFAVMFSAMWARLVNGAPAIPDIVLGILTALVVTFGFVLAVGVNVIVIRSRADLAEQISSDR